MKTVSRRLVMAVLLLGWVQAAAAQTADDIVEKHLTAIGGRAALGKLTSRSMSGTIRVSTPGGDISGTIEILNQAPRKSRSLLRLDLSALGAGEMVQDQRFNGTSGYVLDNLRGNHDITGNQIENMKNGSFPSPLLNYKEIGATLELTGKEKVGEREAYLLTLTPKSGSVVRAYIDAGSYLLFRVVAKVDAPPVGEFEQTTELLDYRDVDGVKVPFQLKTSSSFESSSITFTKVEHNIKMDEALFSRPADAR